jgi:deoxycytidylate deaminase
MFPINLIRHKDPEIFFAIVAPVGADVDRVCDGLSEVLKTFDYQLELIRVIEQLKQFGKFLKNESEPLDEKIEGRMNAGDEFRDKAGRMDALAILAVSKVLEFRGQRQSKVKAIPRQAYLFRSLKRPEEVTALRRIYGSNFILIGVHAGREERIENLAEGIAKSRFSAQRDQFRDKAEKLILRDESDEQKAAGQRLRSAFALADFFLDSSDPQAISRDLERFLNLLFGKPVVTPTPDELGMAHAYVAAMRSGEMGRQVGSAITDRNGNILAVGTNEVPKAHGGYYWDGESYDKRDWNLGFDSSDRFKTSSLGELLQVLSSEKMLSVALRKLSTPEQLVKLAPVLKQTRYMQLIEFIRAVHAEMGALVDAASRGVPVLGCTMYVTTFPCHECARHIVAAGISRLVYIQPYAKSLALEQHGDAIQLDTAGDPNKIPFVPFLGVAPGNYADIFSMPERKGNDGKVIVWSPVDANPRISGSFWSYFKYEKEDLTFLKETLDRKGFRFEEKKRDIHRRKNRQKPKRR